MIRPLLALSLVSLLASAAAAQAVDAVAGDYAAGIQMPAATLIAPENSSKALPAAFGEARSSKVVFSDAKPAVSVAMCGVEAYGANTDLDAGLIDFNVPDPARAAGGSIEDSKDQGRNTRDYHSSVVLGVTLGYHF
jgi:hypothetical protein